MHRDAQFLKNIMIIEINYMRNTGKEKNNIANFIEQFCYIKDKKTNVFKPIKLSNLQKEFINYLNNYGTVSNKRSRNKRRRSNKNT
jgi:hypothetical protein